MYRITKSVGFVTNSSSNVVSLSPSLESEFKERFDQFLEDYHHKIIHLVRHKYKKLNARDIIEEARSLPYEITKENGLYIPLDGDGETIEGIIAGITLDLFRTSKYYTKRFEDHLRVGYYSSYHIPSFFDIYITTYKVITDTESDAISLSDEILSYKDKIKPGSNLIEIVKQVPDLFLVDDPNFYHKYNDLLTKDYRLLIKDTSFLPEVLGFDALFINDNDCLICHKDGFKIQIDNDHYLITKPVKLWGSTSHFVTMLVPAKDLVYFI
jgi:hypothetical protein